MNRRLKHVKQVIYLASPISAEVKVAEGGWCKALLFAVSFVWLACSISSDSLLLTPVAFLLGLHRNDTHQLPENPTPADIITAEEARRTFWTLYINE